MRLAWLANSVRVKTTRSGAPSTDIDPIEPENIPTSKPRSSAIRAEIASYTDPGWTQRLPERIARKRSRRSVQFIVSRLRNGFSPDQLIMAPGSKSEQLMRSASSEQREPGRGRGTRSAGLAGESVANLTFRDAGV